MLLETTLGHTKLKLKLNLKLNKFLASVTKEYNTSSEQPHSYLFLMFVLIATVYLFNIEISINK